MYNHYTSNVSAINETDKHNERVFVSHEKVIQMHMPSQWRGMIETSIIFWYPPVP